MTYKTPVAKQRHTENQVKATRVLRDLTVALRDVLNELPAKERKDADAKH